MRALYLIRHGHPDFPIGSRICLGQTDTPLGPLGHLQGVLLARHFKDIHVENVYSSTLSRAMETAQHISRAPKRWPMLEEQYTGLWDGLSFDEIKKRWPNAYNDRAGSACLLTMPGGEDIGDATMRFTIGVESALDDTQGDIAIVAHAGVIRGFVAVHLHEEHMMGFAKVPKLPYCGYWHLTLEDNNLNTLAFAEATPVLAHPEMDRDLALRLLWAVTPKHVMKHCLAVEALALELCEAIPLPLDRARISHAALLHDIARTEKHHAVTGALWLEKLGYPELADIIRTHHDLKDPHTIDEAAIVYIADKAVKEDRRVPIRDRFDASKDKCQTPAALNAWQRRKNNAYALQDTINTLCGKEILP